MIRRRGDGGNAGEGRRREGWGRRGEGVSD